MLTRHLSAIFQRDLATLVREIQAYPDEASIWAVTPAPLNSGGVLTRHLCGNLQFYIGAVLGGTGYRRDRPAEFAAPPWTRAQLLAEIAATEEAVMSTLRTLRPEVLAETFPVSVNDHSLSTGDFLVHLAVHCGFHLGQVDYHRRLGTAASASVGPMGTRLLASAGNEKALS